MINIGKHKSLTGFTLLELIIVIVVIGILASIALPQYTKVVEKGRSVEGITILSTLRSAQLRYFDQYGAWSTSIDCSNLDVTYTALKFFNTPDCRDGTSGGVIVGIKRNRVSLGGGFDIYDVYIKEDGNITCQDYASGVDCRRIGLIVQQ